MLAALVSRLRRTAVAAVVLAAVVAGRPARAEAQATGVLRFDAAGQPAFTSPYGPVDVGRLQGTFLALPGQPSTSVAVDLFCVDLLHVVSFNPAGTPVYLTNLGGTPSLAFTRQGARYASATPDALTRYRKAAWLIDQFATVNTLTDTAGVQGAMWLQFETSLAPFTYANAGEEQAVTRWTSAADTFAASSKFATYDYSRFTVVTDVNSAGLGADYRGFQEFMIRGPSTAVPEPATVALVAVGLVAVGAASRRRRGA